MGLLAHNILRAASQDTSLSVKCKIPYVNCASRYSTIYKLNVLRASLKLPTGVEA